MSLDLGWTLIPYEAALHQGPAGVAEIESINWREAAQAENLVAALAALPQDAGLLVWCGNSHHSKRSHDGCFPMGYQVRTAERCPPLCDRSTRDRRVPRQNSGAPAATGSLRACPQRLWRHDRRPGRGFPRHRGSLPVSSSASSMLLPSQQIPAWTHSSYPRRTHWSNHIG